jgi:tetratricopeptide (TPR) repeat protein
MRRLFAILLLACVPVAAQIATPEQLVEQGSGMSRDAAQAAERALESNPGEVSARAKLIGYYFYQWMSVGGETARAARRRHILWIIKNMPESSLAGAYEIIIEPRGNQLADEEGFEKARELWVELMETRESLAILSNIARFFQLHDRDLAEKALLRAIQLSPSGDTEWTYRLGYLYGLGILGVDSLAFNGQPATVNPIEADGPFAAKARKALETTKSPLTLAIAGNVLARWGTMLTPSPIQQMALLGEASKYYERARVLDPANPNWRQMQLEAQAMMMRVGAGAKRN